MHIENIIIDIKILETGERIPLDLTFVRGDTDADIDEVFVKTLCVEFFNIHFF